MPVLFLNLWPARPSQATRGWPRVGCQDRGGNVDTQFGLTRLRWQMKTEP